ncbi:MAG: hypothetical protein J6T27_00440 [Alphaproteobacteria bacterium]|jgi:hypothetical protein|nr:hypothetical protein [Alphaproteobacteria bacterium]
MKAKASITAQKLLNLYRQAHVIVGGWAAVNRVFVDEGNDEVVRELQDLPTGKMLVRHIQNLRDGTTPMDSIARELLPYGGMMADSGENADISSSDMQQLISAVHAFNPSPEGMDSFMNTPVIKKFGNDWVLMTQNALSNNPDALRKFDDIVRVSKAYNLWNKANDVLSQPATDRIRASLQVDMPEYETYLPMFGDEGKDLLRRLHGLTSSMPSHDAS